MNHRSLAELYEKRFAEQRREAATGRPLEPLPPPITDESFDRFCENEVDQFLKSLREGGAA